MNHTRLFLFILIVIGLGVTAFITYVVQEATSSKEGVKVAVGETHEVILTETGYEPKDLTINLYDEVVFRTVRGFPHWPASNLHPTHNLYPAFDPRTPVPADEEWSFQFTQAGVWPFHDHLNSTHAGSVTVVVP
jgi:hypothetical protein